MFFLIRFDCSFFIWLHSAMNEFKDFITFTVSPYVPAANALIVSAPNYREAPSPCASTYSGHSDVSSSTFSADTFTSLSPMPIDMDFGELSMDINPAPSVLTAFDLAAEEKFWTKVASLLMRIHANSTIETYNNVYNHCARLNLQFSPEIELIEQWLCNDFSATNASVSTHFQGPLQEMDVFPNSIISDEFLYQYPNWSSHSFLGNMYLIRCICQSVIEEQKTDDPCIDAWSLQMLLVALLIGPQYSVELARATLFAIIPSTWCTRDIFAGGLLRQYLNQQLSFLFKQLQEFNAPENVSTQFPADIYNRCQEVFHHLNNFIGPGKVSDWIAFFEDYTNLLEMQSQPIFEIPSSDLWLAGLKQEWSLLTEHSFAYFPCLSGIPHSVVRVFNNDQNQRMVALSYHGHSQIKLKPVDSIRNPFTLAQIANWERNSSFSFPDSSHSY